MSGIDEIEKFKRSQRIRASYQGSRLWNVTSSSDEELLSAESSSCQATEFQSLMEDSPYDMDTLSSTLTTGRTRVPHVLISLALEEEPNIDDDVDKWKRWLQTVPALTRYVRVQGIYKSNSTLLILSIPVAVWNWLPEDFACTFIGYIHSKNHLDASDFRDRENNHVRTRPQGLSLYSTWSQDRLGVFISGNSPSEWRFTTICSELLSGLRSMAFVLMVLQL